MQHTSIVKKNFFDPQWFEEFYISTQYMRSAMILFTIRSGSKAIAFLWGSSEVIKN